MSPDAGKQWLIYASDADTGTVDVYNYRVQAGKLFGQITGFQAPWGECVDSTGDVYVTDSVAYTVTEFVHGGTSPIKTLSITGDPVGCSVDPTTGNLAVSVYYNIPPTGYGGIWIFPNGSGTPTLYQDPNVANYYSCGFDNRGNLFVEGTHTPPSGPNIFDELPKGGTAFTKISLSGGSIASPAGVMWDGKYVAAADQGSGNTAIYRISISGSTGTIVSTTVLTDTCAGSYADVVQPWINNTTPRDNVVLGGNAYCRYSFDFWNYAKGGNPKRTLPSGIAPEYGSGQTVSPPTTSS